MAKIVFRLTLAGKTPSTWAISQQSVMAPKENKGNKFIAYYPGEDSCFVEDIEAKNKDLKPAEVPLFKFNPNTGFTELAVDENNKALINYLKTHSWYGKSYKIVNKEMEAAESLAEFENSEKALELIKESDELKIRAIAMAVFGLNSFYKSYTQCAAELKAKAFKQPRVIIEAMELPNYETKFVAGLAFVSGIIKLNPTHTAITWSDNDGVILHIAQGENGLDKLTNFLTNESKEAQILLQEFNARLEKKQNVVSQEDVSKVVEEKDAEIAALRKQLEEANKAKMMEPKKEVVEEKTETTSEDVEEFTGDTTKSIEDLKAEYKVKFKSDVPIRYKNDINWIAKKLSE